MENSRKRYLQFSDQKSSMTLETLKHPVRDGHLHV